MLDVLAKHTLRTVRINGFYWRNAYRSWNGYLFRRKVAHLLKSLRGRIAGTGTCVMQHTDTWYLILRKAESVPSCVVKVSAVRLPRYFSP